MIRNVGDEQLGAKVEHRNDDFALLASYLALGLVECFEAQRLLGRVNVAAFRIFRAKKFVRLVNLEAGDKLLAIARIVESAEELEANSTPPMEIPPENS